MVRLQCSLIIAPKPYREKQSMTVEEMEGVFQEDRNSEEKKWHS